MLFSIGKNLLILNLRMFAHALGKLLCHLFQSIKIFSAFCQYLIQFLPQQVGLHMLFNHGVYQRNQLHGQGLRTFRTQGNNSRKQVFFLIIMMFRPGNIKIMANLIGRRFQLRCLAVFMQCLAKFIKGRRKMNDFVVTTAQ